MDIELIAGLSKPKIELTALPTLASSDVTEGDIPDFAALLDGETPDDSPLVEPAPLLDPRVQAPLAMPQEKAPTQEIDARVSGEFNAKVEDINAPDIKNNVGQPAITPLQMKAEQPAERQPALSATATAKTGLPIDAQPKLAQAHERVENAPVPAKEPIRPTEMNPAPIRNKTIAVAAPIAAKSQPGLNVSTFQNLPIPIENPVNTQPDRAPKIRMGDKPVLPAPKIANPIQAQPTYQTGFSNLETVVADPAEVQFSIKIERQTVDIVQPSRTSAPTAPIAKQIEVQLPQLLTKADKQTIELRLDPPELGRVTIHLTTNDQQVTAQVVAERADTIDLMRRHAELLAATLARAGFSQADLSFQQGNSQGNKDDFDQFQGVTGEFESDEPAIAAPTLTGQDGRLDIRL
ncbi:MAG: flagellar hook-length control protein FliK [Rhodobacteraceae bacterium]|nr:flagellar hook-length control protein FliK [Paracoccaceae bacterium]